MRDGHGDIVPEGFYDPPESDDLELIQSEYDKLYTLAQEMAEALEAAKERIIDAKATARGKDTVMIDIEATLTKWAEFKK